MNTNTGPVDPANVTICHACCNTAALAHRPKNGAIVSCFYILQCVQSLHCMATASSCPPEGPPVVNAWLCTAEHHQECIACGAPAQRHHRVTIRRSEVPAGSQSTCRIHHRLSSARVCSTFMSPGGASNRDMPWVKPGYPLAAASQDIANIKRAALHFTPLFFRPIR
jgi:hypothetical protein